MSTIDVEKGFLLGNDCDFRLELVEVVLWEITVLLKCSIF